METVPALRLDGDQIAGMPVCDEVRRWVEAGFDWLQLVTGSGGFDDAAVAAAVAASRPEGRVEVMVGCADSGPSQRAAAAGADRIVLDLRTARRGSVVTGILCADPDRMAVDLPVDFDFLGPDGLLGGLLPRAVETVTEWGARRIILNFGQHTGRLPQTTEDDVAAALGATDASVLIRVAPVRAQDLLRLAERIPRGVAGVVIDPAESPLAVAEAAAGLQDRVELWSASISELGPIGQLPGGLSNWACGI